MVQIKYFIGMTAGMKTLKSSIIFELKSFFGLILQNKKPKFKKCENFLHCGCGQYFIDGWVNADFFKGLKF